MEIPGNDYKHITFTDPDFLFDLSHDSPHPGHAIEPRTRERFEPAIW